MPKQPEGKLVKQIKDLVRKSGGRPFKIHGSDEGVQEVGIPDLLVCYRGLFFGIEVKQPGASLRPRQKLVLHEIFDAGGIAAVVETVEQAVRLLSDHSVGRKSATSHHDLGTLFYRGRYFHQWPSDGIE